MSDMTEVSQPLNPVIDDYLREVDRQDAEVDALTGSLTHVQANWRPRPGAWSVLENLTHLTLTNRAYLEAIEEATCRGRAMGTTGEGPYRHGWLGKRFVASMEPPPKLRTRTFRAISPSSREDPGPMEKEKAVRDFLETQDALSAALKRASGLDLGQVRFRSPLFRLLRLSLGHGFELLLAHNRRHLWQARQVVEHSGFPSATETEGSPG